MEAGEKKKPPATRVRLAELETTVSELRAQTGVEAFELRARVRELERRLDELSAAKAEAPARAAASRKRRPRSKSK